MNRSEAEGMARALDSHWHRIERRAAQTQPPPAIGESYGDLMARASELDVQATRLQREARELRRAALAQLVRQES